MARATPIRAGEPLGATCAGHDADLDLRLAETGVVRGHDQVARHRQLAAPAEGEPANGSDHRDADRADPVPRPEMALGTEAIGRLVGELDDVGTGGERSIPAPVRTATRVRPSRSNPPARRRVSARSAKLSALRASGRSIVTSATP
jgi:hypothetical protein